MNEIVMAGFIAAVIFFAVLTQGISGFGMALVTMAILPSILGLRVASPLVALIAICIEAVILFRNWRSLTFRDIWLAILVSFISIPIGVHFLKGLDNVWGLRILGGIIALYALYALSGFHLPQATHPLWQASAGLFSGLMGGAFNTSGPAMIIYADTQKWEPARFRGNLQGYFIISSVQVIFNHAVSGNFTPIVLGWFGKIALPALIAGLITGALLERRLPAQGFRKFVLILLLVTSLRMAFT